MSEALAIVGMACRYADARSPAELWENVLAQRRAFRRIPPERLRLEDYWSADREAADGIYATEAAVLEGYEFDRSRFRVVGSTYRSADLAHWLALDVAAQALADAGFPEGEGLPKSMAGVLLGNSLTGELSRANLLRLRWPYVRRVVAASLAEEGWAAERLGAFLQRLEISYKQPFAPMTEESLAGGLSNTIAGRICNHFDLQGGGYTVDGACASSLLALCQACSALASGDLDVALAGGVDLSLDPFELVGFSRTGALAEGEMRVYDQRSAGFIPGEGCGMVVLMRHADAAAQGRRVHALIRGWGISSDGHGGISRPEAAGQLLALERAYRRAALGIERVTYFEGHGTGTAVGDATELKALGLALAGAGPSSPLPAIGSVKAVLGHTKAAAGVAGLIKATLAVQKQVLPPSTGCEEAHPEIARRGALRVLSQAEIWPADRPLCAGVSAMGFGGINSHVVVESPAPRRRRALSLAERRLAGSWQDCELLLLAAPDAAALAAQVERLLRLAPRLSRAELADLAVTLAGELGGGRVRAGVVAARPAELVERLEALRSWLAAGESRRLAVRQGVFLGTGGGVPAIGLLFPGQGSPAHLGGGLWRRRFEALEELYAWGELPAEGDGVDTAVAQPAIALHALAGLRLLESLAVSASVAVGHSLGEIVALHWAGAFDEAALLRIARARGRAMAELGSPTGAMAAIAAPADVVSELLADGAMIAGFNSPRSTVVSGETATVQAILERARGRGLVATRLRVSHAFHSPLVSAATAGLTAELAREPFAPLARRVASTVTGALLDERGDLRSLLAEQVTSPVRFTAALEASRQGGEVDLWIEVGPGKVLTDLVAESSATPAIALDVGGESLAGLLTAAAAAYCLGAPIEPAAFFADRHTRPLDLDGNFRFLVNPCELAPLTEPAPTEQPRGETAVREREPAIPTRAAAAIEEPGPPAPASRPLPPLEVVRRLVALRAELPQDLVREDSRLLGDLHLNSISVGQIVVEAARHLGLEPPSSPSDYAQATVAEVAQAIGELAVGGQAAADREDAPPAGVDSWVRLFTTELVERTSSRPQRAGPAGEWSVLAPGGHPLAGRLREALAEVEGQGVAVCLPAGIDEGAIELLLSAARSLLAASGPRSLLLVQEGAVGAAFARTLHLERRETTTCVVRAPFDHPLTASWAAAEARAARGYTEAWYDASGVRRVPVLRPLPITVSAAPPLGPGDVVLATGGGKGIVAECALALARTTGARIAILGRSRPDDAPDLAANLERFRAAGAVFHYAPADVTDGAAVRAAVAGVEAALGPVTAVLHGAGTNVPCLLGALDAAAFARTLAPKLTGAENILAAIDPGRLRLFVAFGSIIARTGMRGEADYALANEQLASWTERLSHRLPSCRSIAIEWSVWSGAGMGERLGRLAALVRQGITPIPADRGVEVFLEVLGRALPGVAVIAAGRFGDPPTLEVERPELPLLRFLERPRVHYPGIELIADAELKPETDPYLDDHVFRGDRLLPAVMGLEAMAQSAMAVAGRAEPPVFEQTELLHPVVVPRQGGAAIRVAALVRAPDRVDVALRTAATGFAVDHFRTTCRFDRSAFDGPAGLPAEAGGPSPADVQGGGLRSPVAGAERFPSSPDSGAAAMALQPAADLYGGVLFQAGRFQRVSGYRRLRATECLAEISPDGATVWFGRYLPGQLLLGDPAARDAAIHAIQACIPHATILPTGVDRIWSARLETAEPYLLAAREREHRGDSFVYDCTVLDAAGRPVERWEGLRLRAVERAAPPAASAGWALDLLGPYLERRLDELVPGLGTRVAIAQSGEGRRRAGEAALRGLLGEEAAIHHRPDGKPEVAGGPAVSLSHGHGVVLAVAGTGTVGCDVEAVAARDAGLWRDLLGAERFGLAESIARDTGEDGDSAATRVWAAGECLTKAGGLHGAPLVLDGSTADGWRMLRSGEKVISTLVTAVRGVEERLALAILLGS